MVDYYASLKNQYRKAGEAIIKATPTQCHVCKSMLKLKKIKYEQGQTTYLWECKCGRKKEITERE
jgi:hypothetical protein